MAVTTNQPPIADRFHQIMAQAQMEHRLMSVQWELTYRCNEKCTHCYLEVFEPGADVHGELRTDECFDILDQLAEEGAINLTLTGGEILVRRDFFQIAEYARKKRLALRLFTNGILIKPPVADRIAALHPTVVELSIYGAKAETHDRITLIPRSHELTLRAVRLLRERNVRVEMKCPLMHENFQELEEMEKLACSLGASFKYDITITPRDGGGPSPLKHRMTDDDLLEVFRKTIDVEAWRKRIQTPMNSTHRFCGIGLSGMVIDPYGEVFPCIQTRMSAGNLREKPLREIWRNSPVWKVVGRLTLEDLPVCQTCELNSFCTRCHGLALVEDGDLYGCSSASYREAWMRRQVLQERGVIQDEERRGDKGKEGKTKAVRETRDYFPEAP